MPFRRLIPLAVLSLVVATTARVRADTPAPAVQVAHIRLSGDLDEAPVADDPIFGNSGENFKIKLDRIKKAKDDKAVKALYLAIDGLEHRLGQAR